jgi:regulator of sigma D
MQRTISADYVVVNALAKGIRIHIERIGNMANNDLNINTLEIENVYSDSENLKSEIDLITTYSVSDVEKYIESEFNSEDYLIKNVKNKNNKTTNDEICENDQKNNNI